MEIDRSAFARVWATEGEPYNHQEAWLDILQLADRRGVIPILPYMERWGWPLVEVSSFFTRLQTRGHISVESKTQWRIIFQAQERDLKQDYEEVWKLYPRKVAKQKGYHAYAAARKGSRKDSKPTEARALFEATKRYARARAGEDEQYTMHASVFFGPDERWKEKHKAKTNSQAKGNSQWARPTSRDLTKDIPPTGTATSRGRKKTSPPKKAAPKNPRKKSPPKADPLGSL
ncbi:MAG: hypothetical protein KAJ42_00405 [Gemmatimonadetes bacterium]|nr:hypothetical protein [Gemmatimonadota bacterium]